MTAIVIDSSRVIRRAKRFKSASLKMEKPPISVATAISLLKPTEGSNNRRKEQTMRMPIRATQTVSDQLIAFRLIAGFVFYIDR